VYIIYIVTVAFYCLQFEYRSPSSCIYILYLLVPNIYMSAYAQGIYNIIKRRTLYYYIARIFRTTSANLHAASVRPICSAFSFIHLIHIVFVRTMYIRYKVYTKHNNIAAHINYMYISDDILVFYLTFILQGVHTS